MAKPSVLEREFVGRVQELALAGRFVTSAGSSDLLVFHGVGGVGKSWLLQRISRDCAELPGVSVARIDFSGANDLDPIGVMRSIVHQLGSERFEAFAHCLSGLEFSGLEHRQAAAVRLITGPVSISIRDSVFRGDVGDIVGIKVDSYLPPMPAEERRRLLRELWARAAKAFHSDIAGLAADSTVLLVLDTFEQLGEGGTRDGIGLGSWLRQSLIEPLNSYDGPKVRIVLAGRERLTWMTDDREAWGNRILQSELLGLSDEDASEYFGRRIGRDVPELAAMVQELTGGIPQCASLACDLISDSLSEGVPLPELVPRCFRGRIQTKLVSEFLVNSILERMPSRDASMIRVCAVPHWFDAAVVRQVFALDDHESRAFLSMIGRYSFVEQDDNWGYRFHDVVRQLLLAQWQHDDPLGLCIVQKDITSWLRQLAQLGTGRIAPLRLALELLYHQSNCDPPSAAATLKRLLDDADQFPNEITWSSLAAAIRESRNDWTPPPSLASWFEFAESKVAFVTGRWSEAEQMVHELLGKTLDRELRVELQRLGGVLLVGRGELSAGIERLKESEQGAQAGGLLRALALTRFELGNAHRQRIDLAEALKYYESCREVALRDEDASLRFYANYAALYAGVVETGLGHYRSAHEKLVAVEVSFRDEGNDYGVARTKQRRGWLARIQGDFALAELLHLEAREVLCRVGAGFALSELDHSLGNILRLQRRWSEALVFYSAAEKIFRAIGARRHLGILLNDWGTLLYEQSKVEGRSDGFAQAQVLLRESISIKRDLGQRAEASAPWYHLGQVCRGLCLLEDAELAYLESVAISREIGVRINLARALVGLADLYLEIGDLQRAEDAVEEALSISVVDGYHHYAAHSSRIKGDLAWARHDVRSMVANYRDALTFGARYNTSLHIELRVTVSRKLTEAAAESADPVPAAKMLADLADSRASS